MPQKPTLNASYRVGHGDVHLSVAVGDGQIGGSAVLVDGELIATGKIKGLRVGNGAELASRRLFVKTIVSDVNDTSNHTSVTYVLEGGPTNERFELSAVVDENGDEIAYRASFDLTGGET